MAFNSNQKMCLKSPYTEQMRGTEHNISILSPQCVPSVVSNQIALKAKR